MNEYKKIILVSILVGLLFGLTACEEGQSQGDKWEEEAPIVTAPGKCAKHPLLGTWTSDNVEGNSDTFTLFEDCTYTRTLTAESGFVDGAEGFSTEEPHIITNRGEDFIGQHFNVFQGSMADELLNVINSGDLFRPLYIGKQAHRIGKLTYYDAHNNLLDSPALQIFVKSYGMPQDTAYMIYHYKREI